MTSRKAFHIFCLILLHAISATLASFSEQQVRLSNGDSIKGSACSQTNVVRFRGIPYAQPPTGSLRFMPPKASEKPLNLDSSAFDASAPAVPCLQFAMDFIDTDPTPSGDCLTLDLYTPSNSQNATTLPVKAWIYGGFNKVGGTSYPLYDACNLATDAVVVEINYRVRPLGFMSLESAGIGDNMASPLHDRCVDEFVEFSRQHFGTRRYDNASLTNLNKSDRTWGSDEDFPGFTSNITHAHSSFRIGCLDAFEMRLTELPVSQWSTKYYPSSPS